MIFRLFQLFHIFEATQFSEIFLTLFKGLFHYLYIYIYHATCSTKDLDNITQDLINILKLNVLHLRKCITLVIEVIILFIRVTVRAITVGIPRSSRGLAAICHVKFSDRAEGHCWCNLCASRRLSRRRSSHFGSRLCDSLAWKSTWRTCPTPRCSRSWPIPSTLQWSDMAVSAGLVDLRYGKFRPSMDDFNLPLNSGNFFSVSPDYRQ